MYAPVGYLFILLHYACVHQHIPVVQFVRASQNRTNMIFICISGPKRSTD